MGLIISLFEWFYERQLRNKLPYRILGTNMRLRWLMYQETSQRTDPRNANLIHSEKTTSKLKVVS